MPRPTSVLDYAAPTAAAPPASNKRPRPTRIADIAALVNETMPEVEVNQLWRAVRPSRPGRIGPVVHVHQVHPTEVVVSTVGDRSNPPHLITVARRRFKEAANGFVLVTAEEAPPIQSGPQ